MAEKKSSKNLDPEFRKARARLGALATNAHLTPEQRFWLKVLKSDGCWEWQGHRNWKGYGEINVKGVWKKAHRFAWEITNGPIPKGMQVCHTCDNRACVRPDHLFVGTNSDNQRDAASKGRGPGAKISAREVRAIRATLAQGMSAAKTATQLGVSYPAVLRVKNRKAFTYVE